MKFYRCKVCGKIIVILNDVTVPTVCCGEVMEELKAGITDAALEKHVPIINIEGNVAKISVGSVLHPMLNEHSIQWICVETNKGYQIKYLKPGEEPTAQFLLTEGEEINSIYEYCNLHGLWKA